MTQDTPAENTPDPETSGEEQDGTPDSGPSSPETPDVDAAADALAEEGEALTAEREDLIASGVDPEELLTPLTTPEEVAERAAYDAAAPPALDDGDADPDNMAGDVTSSDVDLSHLEVTEDRDGGDSDD